MSVIFRLFSYPRILWWRYILPAYIRQLGVDIQKNVQFFGKPIISLAPDSKMKIGENCRICSVSKMTALGVNHPVILGTCRPGAVITIGENTGISGATICAARRIEIGNECLIGANVIIVDTDFHPVYPVNRRFSNNYDLIGTAPVIIEDNVFIGANAIILKGTTIGRDSVIGAGAVVTQDVAAGIVVAGNPAKIIKRL